MNHKKVTLQIPAIAANLGPGYSMMSLALTLYNEFLIEEIESGLQITNSGQYGKQVPVSQKNLVYRAACKLFEKVGYKCPGLRIVSRCNIPQNRGLASSTTAVIAGLIAANRISMAALDRTEISAIASELGEDPEVVSCTMLGGLTMTVVTDNGPLFIRLPFPDKMDIILAIPDFQVSSREFKINVPRKIDIEDVIFNSGRLGLLIAGLYCGETDILSMGLEDKIHFPSLKKKIPALSEIDLISKTNGALGGSICGEGSSFIIFFKENGKDIAKRVREAFKRFRMKVRVLKVNVDTGGTIIGQD